MNKFISGRVKTPAWPAGQGRIESLGNFRFRLAG